MSNHLRLFMKRLTLLGLALGLSACDTMIYKQDVSSSLTQTPTVTRSRPIAATNSTELAEAVPLYQNAVLHPWKPVPNYRVLKPGMKGNAVLTLRERLKATDDLLPENDTGLLRYDSTLVDAVKHFQARNGLTPDGIIGAATFYELNVTPEERLQQIRVNMQRWASLSHQLGERYILVNVPDYKLYYVENGKTLLRMRAIVGKPERPTPAITSTLTHLVFNPYWNVPKTIAEQDIVPKAMANPDYLDDMHIKIFDQQSDNATELSADEVDWDQAQYDGFKYHFRQDPGIDNALGLVKFEFQNSSDIYMHDTPAKNLFNLDKRAFSSGCIRLEKPFELVTYLMESDPSWNSDRLQSILNSGQTAYVKVAKPIKIVITYLTVWADEKGNIQFRDDLYGLDATSQGIQ